jgi:RNA polymerase sigma-70 factor, ECF subfamily
MTRASPGDDVVRRAKAGDHGAWRELYETNAARLLLWLRTRPSGDAAADCEDIAAETWMTAARRINVFSGDDADFTGWLFGIARNLALNAHRRADRRATFPFRVDPDNGALWGTTPDSSTKVEATDWTRRMLSQLPPREAEVVACMDVVGLDAAATSQALGISLTAVRVSRHRGLGRLRNILNSAGDPSTNLPRRARGV